MWEPIMSLLGKLCKLFDFEEIEIDETNREDFKLIGTIWQDYSMPETRAEEKAYYLPDRVYFHLFEDEDGQRCCYMNICANDENIQQLDCDEIHMYNRKVIPWLAGKTSNDDIKELVKDLEKEAEDEKNSMNGKSTPVEVASKPDPVDQLVDVLQYGSLLAIVAPVAEQFLKDFDAGKTQLNMAEVTAYMVRAYKLGLIKGHQYDENEDNFERSYVIQLLRSISNWFTEDGRDAACANYPEQTTKYRTHLLKEVHEFLAKVKSDETPS